MAAHPAMHELQRAQMLDDLDAGLDAFTGKDHVLRTQSNRDGSSGDATRAPAPRHACRRSRSRHRHRRCHPGTSSADCRRSRRRSDWPAPDRCRAACDLLQPSGGEHRDPVGHRHRLRLVVGDIDRGRRRALVQQLQLRAHLHAQHRVEVGERLVEQEHLRVAHQGRPSATRCRCPPDSCADSGRAAARGEQPRRRLARACDLAGGMPPISRAKPILRSTVICG